jgi:hypothetical protein
MNTSMRLGVPYNVGTFLKSRSGRILIDVITLFVPQIQVTMEIA